MKTNILIAMNLVLVPVLTLVAVYIDTVSTTVYLIVSICLLLVINNLVIVIETVKKVTTQGKFIEFVEFYRQILLAKIEMINDSEEANAQAKRELEGKPNSYNFILKEIKEIEDEAELMEKIIERLKKGE